MKVPSRQQDGARREARDGARHGYALPLVMLLALVGGVAATMIVENQGQEHLAELRQIETYRAHHEQQGLAEIIEMWRRYGGEPPGRRAGGALSDAPAPDPETSGPRGFTLRGPAGESYRVEVIDVQGRLLDSTSRSIGLNDEASAVLARAANHLRGVGGEDDRLLRTRGPALIDINTAPVEVIAALVQAVDDRSRADAIAQDLVRQRGEHRLDATRLRRALGDAGLSDSASVDLLVSMVVFESSLQQVKVEARDPVRNLVAHHTGLLLGDTKLSSRHPWAFLSWTRVLEYADKH